MKPRDFSPRTMGLALGRAGARPRSAAIAWLVRASVCGLVGAIAPACADDTANQVTSPIVLGMTDSVPVYYSDAELTLYEVQTQVTLPVRPPTDAERKALGKADPYPRAPFLLASDLRLEVRYTISNLDDRDHQVELLLDPWNEFVHWMPGVTVVNDDVTLPNLSGYDKRFVVPAKSRITGTITPDDTNELAIDLATVENIDANPPAMDASEDAATLENHAFDLQNRSNSGDPLITPYIPSVIAGLTGFDLGLRTTTPANVAVEITVDVTDVNGSRVLPSGSPAKPIGEPGTAISPPGAVQ